MTQLNWDGGSKKVKCDKFYGTDENEKNVTKFQGRRKLFIYYLAAGSIWKQEMIPYI